ncbi:MAG: 30S ribosomal protein S6 [Planctomycetia bacterium]|nr:30S ribosomal protein S6 [Planctomycetia bacterium]NCG11851.1 30S ribosomal protein S6 [Planctomycetia bacterium]NCG57194.1 30S ribosomal protein S6 [Pseudomonadota bacterium]
MTERLYEGLFLIDASVASQGWTELESMMIGIVESHGGAIEYSEKWPEQRLAYEIKGTKRGVYFLIYFRADTQSIVSMRTDAQLNEKIMRSLFVQEDFLEEEMKRRKDIADRRAAQPDPSSAPQRDSASSENTEEGKAPAAESANEDEPEAAAAEAEASDPEVSEPVAEETGETEAAEADTVAVDAAPESEEEKG